jgi:hypothetical protein
MAAQTSQLQRIRLALAAALVFGPLPVALAAPRVPEASQTYVSTVTKLWTEPTKFGEGIALLQPGVALEILRYNTTQAWMKVRTPSGREGWVPARFTSQSSRRTQPVVSGAGDLPVEGEKARGPASVGERDLASVPDAADFAEDPVEFHVGLEYMNELSRENAHGFGAQVGGAYRTGNNWAFGAGLDWDLFSASSQDADFKVSRKTNRFYPHGLARLRYADLRLDLGLGIVLDRTAFKSIDRATGDVIEETNEGDLVSGSQLDTALGLKISPKYYFPISEGLRLGIYATYGMDIFFTSGEGDFAATEGETASRVQHLIGGGLSFSMNL